MADLFDKKSSDELEDKADFIRKKYLYRRLIMKKKTSLSHASAVRLIGPDSAYHLYRHLSGDYTPPTASETTEEP
jgi:predicted ATPase